MSESFHSQSAHTPLETSVLRDLNNACLSPIAGLPGGPREILSGHDKQHSSYLQAHMGHIVASLPQGVRAANLSEGEGRVGVVIVGAKSKDSQSYDVGSKLNMAELGLPKIQGEVAAVSYNRIGSAVTVEAYVLHENRDPASHRLLAPTIERWMLENHAAAIRGPNEANDTDCRWYRPGESCLPHIALQPRIERGPTDDNSVSEIRFLPAKDADTIFITAPTAEERKRSLSLSPEDTHQSLANTRRKVKKGFATVVAALALGAVTSPSPVQDPAERATTAHSFIQQNNEASAVENERNTRSALMRSEQAFQAYGRNDVDALKRLMKKVGYRSDWMPKDAPVTIQQAQTYAALQASFESITPDRTVHLDFPSAEELAKMHVTDVVIEPLGQEDFESAKSYASDILQVLSSLDSEFIQKHSIEIVLVKNIDKSKDSTSSVDPAGFYHVRDNKIFLGTEDARYLPGFAIGDGKDIFAHELMHQVDIKNTGNVLSSSVSNMFSPYKGDDYASSSLDLKGEPIFFSPYASYDSGEDVAETGMLLLRGDSVELTRSLRDKKLIKVLLALEEKMPGFTARWLINTKPTFYKPSEVDMIRYAVGKTGSLVPDDKKPYWPFAPAGLAALYLAAAVVASSRASKAYQTTKTT